MPVEIVINVYRKVRDARWSGKLVHPPRWVQVVVADDWRRLGFDADGRSLRQIRRRLKHNHAVLNYAFVTHNSPNPTTCAADLANFVSSTAVEFSGAGKGSALQGAVVAVIKEGNVRTYDLGGQDSTLDMAKAVAAKL